MNDALSGLTTPQGVDGNGGVVVTFDDGTADWADEVMPVLVEFGVPATFFVATAFVDECRSFPANGTPISWLALKDMATTGLATIGSHTHTHALLDRIDVESARAECERSRGLIEEHINAPCRHFAYPKALRGTVNNEAEVRRIFTSASVAGGRANVPGSADPFRLTRTPIQVQDGTRWFERKASGGMSFEGALRERVSSNRYRDAMD